MAGFVIHPDTRIGAVHLRVRNLATQIRFYRDTLGLRLQQEAAGQAWLGADEWPPLLVLHEHASAHIVRGRPGLFHLALRVPTRRMLARALQHFIASQTPLQGGADHVVSEAVYLPDPEGNGIEVYYDRPRETWPFEDGELMMRTDPLDIPGLLAELASDNVPWAGIHPATDMGHIHLHVNNIPAAEAFYINRLGFELMQRYGPSARFVSAGGYHHHIGLNTWGTQGASPPPEDATGLIEYEILLPDTDALSAVIDYLQATGLETRERDGGFVLRDPSHNQLVLRLPD